MLATTAVCGVSGCNATRSVLSSTWQIKLGRQGMDGVLLSGN
jgi:hypothetical protein